MTNLKLGALGRAVGENANSTSTTRLAADGRGSAAQTSMGDFGYTNTLINSRIGIAANCTWTEVLNTSKFVLDTSADYNANCTMGSVSANTTCQLRLRFKDFFNVNATNYDTNITKSFTIQNSAVRSDVRYKKNIEKIGSSELGLPIFEFEYIDTSHGKGRFRGTIAQELIKAGYAHATILDHRGHYRVKYDKIDIDFESC